MGAAGKVGADRLPHLARLINDGEVLSKVIQECGGGRGAWQIFQTYPGQCIRLLQQCLGNLKHLHGRNISIFYRFMLSIPITGWLVVAQPSELASRSLDA